MPTIEQMTTAVIVCQMLSNFARNIYLFRYDLANQNICILAGRTDKEDEETLLEIEIYQDGNWEFINE